MSIYKMEYENMRMPELFSTVRTHVLHEVKLN